MILVQDKTSSRTYFGAGFLDWKDRTNTEAMRLNGIVPKMTPFLLCVLLFVLGGKCARKKHMQGCVVSRVARYLGV